MGNMATAADIVHFIEMEISYAMPFHKNHRNWLGKWRFLCEDIEVRHWVKGIPQKAQEIGTAGS